MIACIQFNQNTFFVLFFLILCGRCYSDDSQPHLMLIATYPPNDYCFNDTVFAGLEYVVYVKAKEYVNPPNGTIVEACLTYDKYNSPETAAMMAAFTIVAKRIIYSKHAQPTIRSGLSLAVYYERISWLFFEVITKSGGVAIFLLPLITALITWIIEERAYSFLTYFADMLTSYFFSIETIMSSVAAKFLRIVIMFFILVGTSIYLSELINKYTATRTFNGLIEPGGLLNRKIRSADTYVEFLADRGITVLPFINENISLFNDTLGNGTFSHFFLS